MHPTLRLCGALLVMLCPFAVAANGFNWGALKPALADSHRVETSGECVECHADYMAAYARTSHGRALTSCDSCHGPSGKHLEAPRRRADQPVSFGPEGGLSPQQRTQICMQCHQGSSKTYWQGGAHQASDVTCESCHYVMERKSDHGLAINEDTTATCLSCHLEQRGQMLKSAHMPVKQGKMGCTDCHNPHGSSGPKLLAAPTVNEVCYQCHAEKRGPFLWEHAPVREDCSTCHDSHGSNNPGMLNNKGSFLCLSCHQYGGHVNMPRYNRASTVVGQGCVNCHSRVHGSNHPSGAKLTR
jgi:DmsE family decaheme c-type cytochrome